MKSWLVLIFATALGIAALSAMDRYYREQIRHRNYQQLVDTLRQTQEKLSVAIYKDIHLAEHLKAFMLAGPELPGKAEFERFSGLVLSQSPEVRALQYVDRGHIIRYLYPLTGNEAALNLDLMTRPAAPFIEKAIRTRSTTVGDPVTTVQGSLSIVVRSPLFQGDTYLGLAAAVIDIAPLLSGAFKSLPTNIALGLRERNGKILWEQGILPEKSLGAIIPAGDNSWQLSMGLVAPAVVPAPYVLGLIWGLGSALLISLLFIIHQIFRRMKWLAGAVEKRTAELAASEARYRTLVETTDDSIALADPEFNITFCNKAFYSSLGFEAADDAEFDNFARVHPEDLPILRQRLRGLSTSGSVTAEYRVRHKDDHWVYRDARCKLLRDEQGKPQSVLVVAHDITEHKRQERALTEARNLLEKTFASLSDAVFVINPVNRTIVLCNRAVEEIFGYTAGELKGKNTVVLHVDQAAYDRFGEVGEPVLRKQGIFRTEYKMRHRDGRIISTENTVISLADKEEWASDIIVSVVRDITGHKKLEADRDILENQFLQAQKMEAVGQLTAGIAHDFNNLLMAISGSAQLLEMQMDAEDPLRARVDAILQAAERAAELIKQLLIFSRKQVVVPKIVDLNSVIRETTDMLQRVIGENIEVTLDLEPDLWLVKADPGQMDQVVANLAVNARDAMPQGGRLVLQTRNISLDQRFVAGRLDVPPGEFVQIKVSDSGIGMNREVQSHLFEPFFTTKEPGQGTGLGLATVYGIVKQAGGDIAVVSAAGKGSIFEVYLPRTTEIAAPSAKPPTQQLEAGHGTLLLVEDDTAVRKLAQDVLQVKGYTVLAAAHGEEALRVVADHGGTIDLLLTDVIMPGMSGKALAEELIQRCPQLKVIYMSGYSDEVISHHGMLERGINFLQKPVSIFDMMRKVREVLG